MGEHDLHNVAKSYRNTNTAGGLLALFSVEGEHVIPSFGTRTLILALTLPAYPTHTYIHITSHYVSLNRITPHYTPPAHHIYINTIRILHRDKNNNLDDKDLYDDRSKT